MMPFPRENGTMGVAILRLKNLIKMLKEKRIPNENSAAFPKKGLISKCTVCNNVTFYDINQNNKLTIAD